MAFHNCIQTQLGGLIPSEPPSSTPLPISHLKTGWNYYLLTNKLFFNRIPMFLCSCFCPIGTALTDHEMSSLHCDKITSLQRAAFKHYPDDLQDFSMGNVSTVNKRESLVKFFGALR